MAKLTNEQRIEIYERRLKGESLRTLALEFNVNFHKLEYLIRLLKKHGYSVLRNNKNGSYSREFKVVAINRVLLDKESNRSLSINIGLKNTKKTAIML